MCGKAVDICPSVPYQYKTQQLCDKTTANNPYMLKNFIGRYKTHEMCDKAGDDFLPAKKIVSWFGWVCYK